jgi:hypothetical protein
MISTESKTLYSFSSAKELDAWRIVNDGVMGGLSKSRLDHNQEGQTMRFMGFVSLENYGGFASTRSVPKDYTLKGYKGLEIRVKGDGKRYKFRIRTNDNFDGAAYTINFDTEADEWQTFYIPFEEMEATFRGRLLEDYPALKASAIRQLGVLIADKQEGNFKLEVDWIKAIK